MRLFRARLCLSLVGITLRAALFLPGSAFSQGDNFKLKTDVRFKQPARVAGALLQVQNAAVPSPTPAPKKPPQTGGVLSLLGLLGHVALGLRTGRGD